MTFRGVTWRGGEIDDQEIIDQLPHELAQLLRTVNGFIMYHGAFHLRGASREPAWHSLRTAMLGECAFSKLYPELLPSDIVFAEDMFGDQFLVREGRVLRLMAECGEIEEKENSLSTFLEKVAEDTAAYLNVTLDHFMQPGELIFAWPPFCMKESAAGSKMKPCPSSEVIGIHADIARKIRSVPDGGSIQIVWNK